MPVVAIRVIASAAVRCRSRARDVCAVRYLAAHAAASGTSASARSASAAELRELDAAFRDRRAQGQDAEGQRALPVHARDGQGCDRGTQRDHEADDGVVAAQPDHPRDLGRDLIAAGVAEVVVDATGERGEHRVGAGGVVAPALAGQVGRELHEAGAPSR